MSDVNWKSEKSKHVTKFIFHSKCKLRHKFVILVSVTPMSEEPSTTSTVSNNITDRTKRDDNQDEKLDSLVATLKSPSIDGKDQSGEAPSVKRVKTDDISGAFSRKEIRSDHEQHRATTPSVYGDEKKELPAWLKSKPDDKYDKYGSRSNIPTIRAAASSDKDARYEKYGTASSQGVDSRLKRTRDERDASSPSSRYGVRNDAVDEEDNSAVLPYNNLEVTNPAAKYYQTFTSNIANKDKKDINSIVRSHYNQRAYQAKHQGSRTQSPIYKLRNFNNAIKYMLLGNFIVKVLDKPTVILDLCCGKGGDLNKYEFVSIDQYIGIDISDASVKEGFSRYSKNKARFIPRNPSVKDSRRYNFEACFATGDCFQSTVPDILEPNFPGIMQSLFPVSTVSTQFSLHYSFESEDKVRGLLNNVSRSLRKGGTFIGTIPSSDFIRDKILRKELVDGRKFGNQLYSVTFDNPPPEDGEFRPPFGHRYTYYLRDAVDNVPEYVVPFQAFRALCEDYGLVLKYKKSFVDIFNQEIPKYFHKLNKNLVESMKRSDGKYGAEGAEKEAVAFYIGFVFEKL
ncbi:uncharacterized protein PRCAT00002748001 [Priceomyces carsonii]|uniref:uncharacterized protein n=1 Tax=Priceomyces carsonii TaxID=28549 RepID=UPI002ED7EAEA|nr:unnamed protein product [Priceomyces carsonii]